MSRPKPEGYNRLLYAARMRNGWTTYVRAAEEVTKVGRRLFNKPTWEITPRSWRRWESPNPGLPNAEALQALTTTFGCTYEQLGFVTPFDLAGGGADPSTGAIIASVNRRDFVTSGAAAAFGGLPWLAAAPGTQPSAAEARVGIDQIEDLRATLDDLDAIDQRFGSDRLWRPAQTTLQWVHTLLDRATFTADIAAELHSIAGSLTTSLAWYLYDAEQQERAAIYFGQALNTALLSNDRPLAVRTLSNMSRQAVDLGKARDAIRYAQLAATHVGAWAPPRVHSLIAVREAQGFARLGDTAGANGALRRAWQAFEDGPSDRDPEWSLFLNEAELACLEGMCRSDLGQHQKAVSLLERSASLQDAAHDRNRGMCLVRLSGAALHAHDLDRSLEAANTSITMIAGGMTSRRNKRVLQVVANDLHTYGTDVRARSMIEQINTYAA
ncbi:hypothetical protein ACFVSN_30595 [Kitasatospora sp. NPDC057904]|uniref:hypothetical protein n=1 Tax=Kitasatospora sp. NPDC057904 TaxID=3346275 RepID=UPI0036DCDFB5